MTLLFCLFLLIENIFSPSSFFLQMKANDTHLAFALCTCPIFKHFNGFKHQGDGQQLNQGTLVKSLIRVFWNAVEVLEKNERTNKKLPKNLGTNYTNSYNMH